jgi:uncharacterized protein YidB (DUF937 family)
MGLFDDFINKVTQGNNPATQGNNPSDPLVVALNKLLAGNAPQGSAGRPQSSAAPADSTVGSDSDLISGLNGLLAKLQAAGLGDAVKSWVGTGQNAQVQPGALGRALGNNTVREIAGQAGIKEDDLLTQLSKALPAFVDKLTPNGRLPSLKEISDMLQQPKSR